LTILQQGDKGVRRNIGSQSEIGTQIKNSGLVRQKRLQIAMGASKLFVKKGYFQTSIREISKATGLTIGSLYDYITKKEDVLYLVFDVFHSMWTDRLKEEGVFDIEDPVQQLRIAVQKMLDLVTVYREMNLFMYTETKLLPKDFLETVLEKESGLVGCFEKILKDGVKRGAFKIKDPFFMANIIVYMLSLEPLRGWNLKKRYRVEEINRSIVEYVLDMVLKESKNAKRQARSDASLPRSTRRGFGRKVS
jgi:TetR/AcrR family transcriptional regulator, cholesterol catabolism regulator